MVMRPWNRMTSVKLEHFPEDAKAYHDRMAIDMGMCTIMRMLERQCPEHDMKARLQYLPNIETCIKGL